MASAGYLVLVLLFAGTVTVKTERNLTSDEVLSAESTGLDYSRQFGRAAHAYGPYQGNGYAEFSGHWVPFHPYQNPSRAPIDPYVVQLMTRYVKYLPQGLGLYGIYGSTGLPHPKPPGMFRFAEKARK